jgi:hypothetical protein
LRARVNVAKARRRTSASKESSEGATPPPGAGEIVAAGKEGDWEARGWADGWGAEGSSSCRGKRMRREEERRRSKTRTSMASDSSGTTADRAG